MQANITREIGRTEASNRSANGRFAAGNPGGPGNPFAGLVASLRQAMLECVSKEDIQSIMKSLVEMA
jgi:hypothetical protein